MADPNMSEFYGRIARIQKARAKGMGFEAPGTLGRSHYYRAPARKRSLIGPVLFLLVCGFLMKGTMYQQVGADIYNERVAALTKGEGMERVGGFLMQADPVTIHVAGKIEDLLMKLK